MIRNIQNEVLAWVLNMEIEFMFPFFCPTKQSIDTIIYSWRVYPCGSSAQPGAWFVEQVLFRQPDLKDIGLDACQI